MRIAFLLIAGCFIFWFFPQIDLWFSSLFFKNGVFFLKNHLILRIIYKATMILITLFTLSLALLLLIETVTKKEWVSKKILIYLLLVLLLGPGLVVNVVFKNHFGRARPSQVEQFAGTKKFTPALQIANQCKKNCSFSSGHAAAAFYFLALIPLFHGRKRRIVAALAIIWGSVVGLVRIAQGGHFLSDVYCSAVVVYLVTIFLHYLLFERKIG
ncbi:phosphatase PAP2 family protein [Nitratiruptor sp. SB155-2]|uniref:phosphatase PAP2 family protein n=1 Tax=Nitratiruptor sp. (strain SB155-2) TaxID=387092 RepID=UPI0001586FC8|nr:phosphatase PAP2 family protein [Nitratiruptor sp. SB155-2]BAF70220.1 membrane-associated phospholipid phosphatase [Nitratiruptor sp. SB155-2]